MVEFVTHRHREGLSEAIAGNAMLVPKVAQGHPAQRRCYPKRKDNVVEL